MSFGYVNDQFEAELSWSEQSKNRVRTFMIFRRALPCPNRDTSHRIHQKLPFTREAVQGAKLHVHSILAKLAI
jgi:hypothetical protein